MICKIIMIPVAVIASVFSIFSCLVKAAATLVLMVVRFTFDRGFGAVFGAVGGGILGRRHLKIKVF